MGAPRSGGTGRGAEPRLGGGPAPLISPPLFERLVARELLRTRVLARPDVVRLARDVSTSWITWPPAPSSSAS
ncbi:hypothetical protein [Streptomyces sp. NPDC003720]|uniref:hypothetical protein n=1 Tax=Streptomyces sp. NPDC003720 TaxID=3364684 RepID=UPI0036A92882